MTQIMIHLEDGPDGQPAGQLSAGSGHVVAFTGWLQLIRLLEAQLALPPWPAGAAAGPAPARPERDTAPG
jgi:hypothetical protein